jgi:hypothetical protein
VLQKLQIHDGARRVGLLEARKRGGRVTWRAYRVDDGTGELRDLGSFSTLDDARRAVLARVAA